MKRIPTILTIFCFFYSLSLQAQTWTQVSSIYNYGRYDAIAVGCDTLAYAGMGQSANGGAPYYLNDFWQYSPKTNHWMALPSFPPGGRYLPSAFAVNHLVYVCCGFDNTRTPQNDLWVFNPAYNNWTQLASLPDTGRYACSGFVIGDSVFYLGTGTYNSSTHFISGFYKYSPKTNKWTKVASFGGGTRANGYSFQINNVGYVGGGGANDFDFISDLWAYYPDSNKWVQKTALPSSSCWATTSFSLNGFGYVVSGQNNLGNANNNVFVYNPANNSWSVQTNAPFSSRKAAASFVVGNNGFVGLGADVNGEFTDFWTFTGPQNILGSGPASLSVSTDTLGINASGNSKTFKIYSNVGWNVSSTYKWLTPGITSGFDTTVINLNASSNPTVNIRVDTVIVSGSGVPTQKIVVTQAAGPPTLSISKDTLNIDAAGNSQTSFKIFSNEAWSLTAGTTQTWLSPSLTYGTDTSLITLTAAANTSLNERIDTIIVSGNGINSQYVIITQAPQSGSAVIDITGKDFSLYPIPVMDNLMISFQNPPDRTHLSIYNINGIEIYSGSIVNSVTTVDMSKYLRGVYIVKVITPDRGILTRKIEKQ